MVISIIRVVGIKLLPPVLFVMEALSESASSFQIALFLLEILMVSLKHADK